MSRIEASDAHFDAFVAILQELNITKLACELKKAVDPTIKLPVTASRPREDSDSGSASGAESVDATGFKCPCGQCSITSYLKDRSKCPGQQEGTFPHLDLDNLGKDEKEALRRQLVRDTDKIMEKFDDFSDGVFEALKRNKTPVEGIVNTIITSGQRVPRPIQDTPHGDKLETITTITGIHTFLVRHKYISFINYRILEKVISKHCKECQEDLDEYVEKFKMFGKRNVFEVPPNVINSSASGPVLVVKVINEIWFGVQQGTQDNHPFSVNDVCAIQDKIAEVIETDILRLIDISEGCIQLAFEVLSCQEAPIFPLTTSQLRELIRCGIIVLYQPNLPSLPTNIQDTNGQIHDIQSTDADDSETPPTIPSADDSETPPTIPSADDTETPPTIPSAPVLSTVKPLPSQFTDDSRSMISGYSGSTASSSEKLQEPGVSKLKRRDMYEGLPLGELKRRIADKKSRIEHCKDKKTLHQQRQREAKEEVRRLKSLLAQTTDEDDRRELEKKIHNGEVEIKVCKEKVQQCEEWINKAESNLLSLNEAKDKESNRLLDLGMTTPSLRTDTLLVKSSQKPSIEPMAPPSNQPVTVAAVKPTVPSSGHSQLQTSFGMEEFNLPLTMEELERRIADKNRWTEYFKERKADYQQWQREIEERVRVLQSRLAQTTDEHDRRELERKIHDGEMEIKVCKERLQQCDKWINEAESDILPLTETKNKESKRLLDEETSMTSPSLQTDTSRLKTVQSSEQPQHQNSSGKEELPLAKEELEERIAGKKGVIEFWKEEQAFWQQEQRKSEKRVRVLQSRLAQTTDEDVQRELEWNIHDEEERIKSYKEKVQRWEERITETDLLALAETKNKEQSQLQTLSGKKELPLTMEELEIRIAEKKSRIEEWKELKSSWQQEQREAEERVRVLQSRLAQTTDEDDRRELEWKIHGGEEWIKRLKEAVQLCEWINEAESAILALIEAKDKEFDQSDFNLQLVSKALTDLLDWYKLGLMLGLKKIKLDQIRVDFEKYGSEPQRDVMVDLWLRSDEGASWEKLCTALENMNQNTIADEIRRRYSIRRK